MNTTKVNFSGENISPLNLKSYLLKYVGYWYWFVISICLTISFSYWYLHNATPIYNVSASFLIESHPKNAGENLIKAVDVAQENKIVENEIEVIKSRNLMLNVVDNLALTVGYFKQSDNWKEVYETSPIKIIINNLYPTAYQKPIIIKIINKNQFTIQNEEGNKEDNYNFNQKINCKYGTFYVFLKDSLMLSENNRIKLVFFKSEEIAQYYKSALKVELLNQKSTVLKVTLEDAIPERGKAILKNLLQSYIYSTSIAKENNARSTLQFIDDRLRLVTDQLVDVERKVESYKSTKGITDLSAEGSLYLGAVKGNDEKLNEVEVQLKLLNGLEDYLKSSQNGFAPATFAGGDPLLSSLLEKLNALQTQQDKYARTTQGDNPFLQTINSQIVIVKNAIQENVTNQRQNLLINRTNLEQQSKHFESSISTIPGKERELITIKRQQSVKESLYLLLLQKKEETAISYASALTESRIIDDPYASPFPIRPNHSNIYLLAILAGFLIPVSFIYLRKLISNTVDTRKEIENETGLIVFGEIMKKDKNKKSNLVMLQNDGFITEQFKTLRANLRYVTNEIDASEGQVILITSSISKEGKSFVTINLASSLAQLGKRVLILEMDLRRPKIADYLGILDGQEYGVTDYINHGIEINELIRPVHESPNLYFISSGPIPTNPSELISNKNVNVLFKKLRQQFEYIIVDAPPVAYVADAILLEPCIDQVFYVVRYGYTPKTYMSFLSKLITSQRFKSLNIVFNGINPRNNPDYSYEYSYKYKNK